MKGKNAKSVDQKKLIALALAGGLVWGGYTAFQGLERQFSRLPVMGSTQSSSEVSARDGLTHLAPVQISSGGRTDSSNQPSRNQTADVLQSINRKAFETPKIPVVVAPEQVQGVNIESPEEEKKELSLTERFLASGPHNLLGLVEKAQQPKLEAIFLDSQMAVIDGQLIRIGEPVRGFAYNVPDLESESDEAEPLKRTPYLASLTKNSAVLTDQWNQWEQTLTIHMRHVSIPVTGSLDEIVDFYSRFNR
ncbi:MAG: hypothetical protein IBX50_05980 [Marinospirillum sp.]|uniref:hypothetical protein n=1 Tax=Marinospirillum sp. TaxID=2183934 RepID=UPI0019F99B66|nr:hypothetical protein [Marinospirillum sp.]MBE0506255.1 hypothetical protein [Marinospirillum sp.]